MYLRNLSQHATEILVYYCVLWKTYNQVLESVDEFMNTNMYESIKFSDKEG